MENNYALALCGGGGKGAYQIGMWKAFDEKGITPKIKAVSGASVGALNAVLFALGDYALAESIWRSIDSKTLLSPSKNGHGLCSRSGLMKILDMVDVEKLKNSIDVYVNVCRKSDNATVTYRINDMNRAQIEDVLLASSAIPVVYSSVKIDGEAYIDGGHTYYGNVPVDALYSAGWRNIIIGAIDNDFNVFHMANRSGKKLDIEKDYPDAEFIVFQPLENNGGAVTGMFDFSKESLAKRIQQGYEQTISMIESCGDVYCGGLNFMRLNVTLRSKIKEYILNANELDKFIKMTDFGTLNVKFGTLGGHIWYKNVVEIFGRKLQQHKIIPNHYRFIDENDMRTAWTLRPEMILKGLENYNMYKN